MPTVARLSKALDSVVDDFVKLTQSVKVRYRNYSGSGIVFVAPEHHWSERTPRQQHAHLEITRRYRQIVELISVLIKGAPPSLTRQLKDGDKHFTNWLELGSNWSLSTDQASNEKKILEAAAELQAVVSVLSAGPREHLIFVPDTNSLLVSVDPTDYRSLLAEATFEFLLLPTVLAELDELKVLHRNQDVREKAKRVITRIKGWRAQGSLLEGVIVDKTIKVRALHNEPKVAESLSWLDAKSADDRIVASVLHIQASSSSSRVVLVTGDINLQNKADAAMIETAELDIDIQQ